jgi:hypothetical protein
MSSSRLAATETTEALGQRSLRVLATEDTESTEAFGIPTFVEVGYEQTSVSSVFSVADISVSLVASYAFANA